MTEPRAGSRLARNMTLWAIALLPLEQAFTIRGFFTIQASIILLTCAFAIGLPQLTGAVRPQFQSIVGLARAAIVVTVFLGVFHFFIPQPLSIVARLALAAPPNADLIRNVVLVVFGLTSMLAVIQFELGVNQLDRAMTIGVRLATVIAAYVIIANLLRFPLPPGTTVQAGDPLFGLEIARNGSFEEGNYLGFYAGAAGMYFLVRRKTGMFGVAAVLCLVSQSTTAAGMMIVGAGIYLMVGRVRAGSRALTALLLLVILAPTLGIAATKLAVMPTDSAAASRSTVERAANYYAGFKMALREPLVGVGPGRWDANFDSVRPPWLPPYYLPPGARRVANSIYLQAAAEYGLILFTLIALIIICAMKVSKRSALPLTSAIALGGLAYPGIGGLTYWLLLGVAASLPTMSQQYRPDLARVRETGPNLPGAIIDQCVGG